jgi:type IV pilus assembly protein PilB
MVLALIKVMQTNIINTTNTLLQKAIEQGASDLHIEPQKKILKIRLRVDAILHTMIDPALTDAEAIKSRLKIMAKLDITERRLPQDGCFIFVFFKKSFDCRLSSCPSQHGEKIVIRILNTKNKLIPLNSLGLLPSQFKIITQSLSLPQGLVLVTGPTGSGKTQTLYTLLNSLNKEHKNIISIEDPIEIQLNDITQINVNHKIGLDFATLLRAILRQDPDVIMVGEIRDYETAEMVVRAAHTGHLVFATLHTKSANDTMSRLRNIGIEQHDLDNTLNLIINQRLMRKICTLCQKNGCRACRNGYKGRTAIFELSYKKQQQQLSLWQVALQKISQGITDTNELYRTLEQP